MSPAAPPAVAVAGPAPRGDFLLALAVLGVVALLLLPLPAFALDGLLATSIGVSLLVLLVALGVARPLDFSVFPTLLLVVIYLIVSAGAQSFHGPGFLENNAEDVLSALGEPVLGGVLYKLLIISVLTSASASTQTTILPTA